PPPEWPPPLPESAAEAVRDQFPPSRPRLTPCCSCHCPESAAHPRTASANTCAIVPLAQGTVHASPAEKRSGHRREVVERHPPELEASPSSSCSRPKKKGRKR